MLILLFFRFWNSLTEYFRNFHVILCRVCLQVLGEPTVTSMLLELVTARRLSDPEFGENVDLVKWGMQ